MSYYTQALMTQDEALTLRLTAAAACEGITDPQYWVQRNAWTLTAQPGWSDAYVEALKTTPALPGANETAVPDSLLLAGVRAVIETPESPAE